MITVAQLLQSLQNTALCNFNIFRLKRKKVLYPIYIHIERMPSKPVKFKLFNTFFPPIIYELFLQFLLPSPRNKSIVGSACGHI